MNNKTSILCSSSDVTPNGLATVLLTYSFPTAATLVLLISIFLFLKIHTRKRKNEKLPPGPVPWPIVGNIPELLMIRRPAFRWIERLMNEMNTEIACIRFGSVHVIPVTCPKIAREFLKKQDATFVSRPVTMATEYASRGFMSVALSPWGDQWKKMRRVVASEVLSPARMKWLLDKRTEEADNLIRFVYNQCNVSGGGGAVVDVRVATRSYTGNVIRKMTFNKRYFGEGSPDGGPGAEELEHVDALFTLLSLLYAFNVSDYIPRLRCLDLDGHEKIMKAVTNIVNKYHDRVIDERIQEWRGSAKVSDGFCVKREPEDLLDVLVSLKDGNGKPLLSTEEIKAHSTELMYTTVDNPAHAVEWALAEMMNQPEILKKAVAEIDRVLGKDKLVQESDIPQLNYVKACAREALRLHPVTPFNVPRMSTADATVAGYFIPKGSHVLLSRVGLGRNPKVWEDPLKFKPERHLSGAGVVQLAEPELRFISFSTGRRGCMGASLGSAITVMLLARLLQGFDWSPPPGQSAIDLSESAHNLFLAEPLRALAKPRLSTHMY